MPLLGGRPAYRLLRWLSPAHTHGAAGETRLSYVPKIKRIIGERGWDGLRDRTLLDFGCGVGAGSVEMAVHGARRVIGLDIRPDVLGIARDAATAADVSTRTSFVHEVDEPVDVIVSIDAFEHFSDPVGVLATMNRLLRADGFAVISFGPTWYHPRGGHLFSVFPWSHLLFSEQAQLRWRSDFKHDGARRFSEVAGGLNAITISKFVRMVERSPFRFELFRTVPIRPLAWAHSRLTREFTTSVVECKLVKR